MRDCGRGEGHFTGLGYAHTTGVPFTLLIHARIQRGDRGSGPPPRDLSEAGSCVDDLWIGEGVQRLFVSYYNNFFLVWLASLASIVIE